MQYSSSQNVRELNAALDKISLSVRGQQFWIKNQHKKPYVKKNVTRNAVS